MTPEFIAAIDGSLLSTANISCVRPIVGRARTGQLERAQIVLTDGSTCVADSALLEDSSPIGAWPIVEGGTRIAPATIAQIKQDGTVIGPRGEVLGWAVNADRLQELSRTSGEANNGRRTGRKPPRATDTASL